MEIIFLDFKTIKSLKPINIQKPNSSEVVLEALDLDQPEVVSNFDKMDVCPPPCEKPYTYITLKTFIDNLTFL